MKKMFFISLLLTSVLESNALPVVINEIHYDPDVKTEMVEFVELYNTGTTAVDISGWHFSDGISYTFPPGARLPANGYLVVVQDRTGAINSVTVASKYGVSSSLVFGPFSGRLNNEGERIRLCNAIGVEVDEVDYQLGFPWPTVGDSVPAGTVGRSSSIQLANPGLDNDLGGSWRSAYPTPAARNTAVYAANIPPQIRQVEHMPKQPKAGEVVTITAKVTDPDGVAAVTLHYQFVNPGSYIPITLPNYPSTNPATVPNPAYENAASWTNLVMYDNGLNGDSIAGDSIYTIRLPTSVQIHRRLVRYRITVRDNSGRSVRVPYIDDPQPNFAYFVYNDVPAWSGAIQPGSSNPQKAQVHNFSAELLTSLPVYHLIAREQDVLNCQYNESYFNMENHQFYFSGTLVYDGEVYDNIHFRIRGTWSTFRWGKNKWKFDFNRGHWFQGRDDYGNQYNEKVDKFNLGNGTCPWWKYPHPNGNWDQGTGGMMLNEPLAYRLYRMAGVPTPNTHFIQLRIIDRTLESEQGNQYEGDFWGLYFVVEQVDGNFLDERQLPDGNIYRMEGSINQNHQCNTQVSNQSDVINFIAAFQNSHPSKAWWSQNFSLSTYYSSKAIGTCTNDSDRRVNFNCVYYRDSITGLWLSLPWDLDLSFEVGRHYEEYDWEHFHYAIDDYPEYAIAYRNRARELQDLLLNSDQAWQVIDELASFVYDPNASASFIDSERARWDYAPRVSSSCKGLFYEQNEFLNEKSFAGVVAYMKQFILPSGFGYPYGGPNLDQQTRDADIPDMPTVTYTGSVEFPINDLTFETNSFNDPQGNNTFAAMKWRIAEVEPGSQYVPPASSTLPETVILLEPESSNWKYLKGNNGEPSNPVNAWRQLSFNDSSWYTGQTSIGFGDFDDNTVLNDMQNRYSSIYLRHKFNVSDIDEIGTLILGVYVDDGCIVWINGAEVARLYVSSGFKAYNGFANNHEAQWEQVTLPAPYNYIVEGENIIAVHALNASLDSSDFSIDVALTSTTNQDTEEPNNPPANTFTHRDRQGKYEIETLWESDEVTQFSNTIRIPASGLKVGSTYRVRCRMKDNTGRWSYWSDPVQFVAGEPLSAGVLDNLRITEVMYNPADADISKGELGVDNDEFEFIELKNIGSNTLDLTNVSFVEGINFDFASGSIVSLAPGAFVLVVKNRAAFESRYGGSASNRVTGEYDGKLANEGEKVCLTDLWNGTIVEFEYSDGNDWPQSADGEGDSLVPVPSAIPSENEGSLNDSINWIAALPSPGR